MEIKGLRTNQLVQDGRTVLKVSTIYSPTLVTAEVVYPVPPRTTVREFTAEQVGAWTEPSDRMVTNYERAWSRT